MSSGSLKDAVRALNTAFSAPTVPHPLPEELQQTIETFLDRYQHIDDHDSQRLQDELLNIYNRHVSGSADKHGAFLHALTLLRPAIRGDKRLNEWWNLVIRPTIDAIGHKRDEIEEAREFLLGILVFDAEEDRGGEKARLSANFTQRLLDAYLARTRIPMVEGDSVSPEDEFIAHELEALLIAFGRRKPKELLLALDALFAQKNYRAQALSLLSAFVRIQPPHLYLVLETPLIHHLEKCLMIDTSATVVELALTVLIMFLPHITSSLVSHLPKLFLIYIRILCWEQFGIASSQARGHDPESGEKAGLEKEQICLDRDPSWERLQHAFDGAQPAAPGLVHYFTFLYGLFPLNFMGFIRKPRKFLKTMGYAGADEIGFDKELIRNRTEPLRQVHLLHPNFFTSTPEDELDEKRWLKSDPADVVTDCMGLCMAISTALDDPGPPPTSKLPEVPQNFVRMEDIPHENLLSRDDDADASSSSELNSKSSWRHTHSTTITSPTTYHAEHPQARNSPAIHSIPPSRSSRAPSPTTRAHDAMMDSPTLPPVGGSRSHSVAASNRERLDLKPRKGSTTSFNTSSPTLETFSQALSQRAPNKITLENQSLASLQREVMLLRNDLNFERYLKHQHMSHIGQLQRKNIKEATVEAETQNLINTNRKLKAKLAKANELYAQLKKETVTGRNQSKRWESELSAKVRSFREEQQQWQAEETTLRQELQKAQHDCERLKRLVVESESRELNAKQKLRALEMDMEELASLRLEVEQLHVKLRQYELRELDFKQAEEEQETLRTELQIATMRLSSRDSERMHMKKRYEDKITDLEKRLKEVEQPAKPGELPPAAQQVLDSALAASNAKYQQLRKTHTRLLHRFTELEMRYQELEAERELALAAIDGLDERASLSAIGAATKRDALGSGLPFGYQSRFPRASQVTSTSPPKSDEEEIIDGYSEYNAPSPARSRPSQSSSRSRPSVIPSIPARIESLQNRQGDGRSTPIDPAAGQLESGFLSGFQAAMDSGKSAEPSSGVSRKNTSSSTSSRAETRVFGRGGVQNTPAKKPAAVKSESKVPKGGFRGLKAIK